MEKRFVPILDQLPERVDWQLHVITISRSNFYGEPMRGNHNPQAKKLLAAALCREAAKLGATGTTSWIVSQSVHALTDESSAIMASGNVFEMGCTQLPAGVRVESDLHLSQLRPVHHSIIVHWSAA